MEKRKIRVGSRESALAVAQTKLVLDSIREQYPEIEFELVTMKTTGDKILDKTLDKIGGKGLFVKELDRALRAGEVDLTVHSLKDVPAEVPEDLPILAFAKRGDPRDALVLREGLTVFPETGVIGCSSMRRTMQLRKLFPECTVKPVRGNILTRLAKLDAGEFDALVLAAAGLERMALSGRISRYFSEEEMLPAAGQGILAVQGRKDASYPFLDAADDPDTRCCALAERAFIRELNAGCSSPAAAFAVVSGGKLRITGLYPHPETGEMRIRSVCGTAEKAEHLGQRLAAQLAADNPAGKVWLVGAGPGDPGLLTVKGQAVLEQAEVVVYDRLVGPGILAKIPRTAEAVDVGKCSGNHPVLQEEINQILLEKARQGFRVVRLKGGDPFVFGRGGEEAEQLAAGGIPFEIVPGVTSAVAVPAYAGIPVTHRGCASSFHVITGHTRSGEGPSVNFSALEKLGGTLIFLMGLSSVGYIAKGLLDAGMSGKTPAAVLERGTTAHQRRVVSTLEMLREDTEKAGIASPAIIVVGEVCGLSEKFAWAEARPLGGVRAMITRPQEGASRLAEKLSMLGAEVLELPTIETEPIEDPTPLQRILQRIDDFRWLVFSSPSGVRYFFKELLAYGMDSRDLSGKKVAAVGASTAAALEERGIRADLVPEIYDGAHLGKALSHEEGRMLLVRPESGSPGLLEALRQAGREFEEAVCYCTKIRTDGVLNPLELLSGERDYALFASSSAVKGFVSRVGEADFSGVRAVCIGKQTAAAAGQAGMQVFLAETATLDGMVEVLLRLMEGQRPDSEKRI